MKTTLSILILALLLAGCGPATDPPAAAPAAAVATLPLRHAETFRVETHPGYRRVIVTQPWPGAARPVSYLLVPRGEPRPPGHEADILVPTPVRRIICMTTSFLPHLEALGLVERIVAVDDDRYIHSQAVRRHLEAAAVPNVGAGAGVNVERVLELAPDMVLLSGVGDVRNDCHQRLLAAGVPVVLIADYMEEAPLGRSEWIKFLAAFTDRDAAAAEHFAATEQAYLEMKQLAAGVTARPTVLVNVEFNGAWYMPGRDSFLAQLIEDAGGRFVWAESRRDLGQKLAFEVVLAEAGGADFWINTGVCESGRQMLAMNEHYAQFAAFKAGRLYNHIERATPEGGNDYWESGAANPHLVLADLIHIFHPRLLPDHRLYYYRKLPETVE